MSIVCCEPGKSAPLHNHLTQEVFVALSGRWQVFWAWDTLAMANGYELTTTADDVDILGKIMTKVPELAREQGLAAGFKTGINTGKLGGQEVYHLHMHVMGGPRPWARG